MCNWSVSPTYLHKQHPNFLKDGLVHVLLDALESLGVQICCLARELGKQCNLLLIANLLLEKYLLRLSQRNANQGLDSVSAKVGGWRMQEILIYIGEHASGGLEGMVGGLEA